MFSCVACLLHQTVAATRRSTIRTREDGIAKGAVAHVFPGVVQPTVDDAEGITFVSRGKCFVAHYLQCCE